jgi:single cache domain-containing protein
MPKSPLLPIGSLMPHRRAIILEINRHLLVGVISSNSARAHAACGAYPNREKTMIRTFMIAAASAAVLTLSPTAFAQQPGQFGTADEAKAMLTKAVAAVNADKAKALDMFNKGEGGFLDRDLYPFCANISDGKFVAVYNPNVRQILGTDIRTLKDSTGKAFGLEQFAAAQKPEGQFTEVSYLFPRPGTDPTPVPKVSFTTRVADLMCGVGYYK